MPFPYPTPAPLPSHPHSHAPTHGPTGTELDTGIDARALLALADYWDTARGLYAPFESNLLSSSSEVYYHEMPGGQFTNLRFQSLSLGLGAEWPRVKKAYAEANRALGDIVKARQHGGKRGGHWEEGVACMGRRAGCMELLESTQHSAA